jgi:DNA-binding LytR/AlgR family response regulator
MDSILVENGSLTRIVARQDVSWIESSGDYVRLHERSGAYHLVRMPISMLEERWSEHGFVRIHRSYLVALTDIHELRTSEGHTVVGVGDFDLPVSRRHAKELRDRLVRHARGEAP